MDPAIRLPPEPARDAARHSSPASRLTEREQQVLAYARRGCTNKAIAAALDVAPSTVSTHLRNGLRRLGASDLVTLAKYWPRLEPDPTWHCGLTRAEIEVASLASAGLSNREIAARRATAARTVANQIAAVLRKLGVDSRRDLVVRWVPGQAR